VDTGAHHPLLKALQAQAQAIARGDQDALELANRTLEAMVRAPQTSTGTDLSNHAKAALKHQLAANRRALSRAQGQVQRGLEALQVASGTYDARAEVHHQAAPGRSRFTA
jgi:hypothetical protein